MNSVYVSRYNLIVYFMQFLIKLNRKWDDYFYCVILNNAICIIDRSRSTIFITDFLYQFGLSHKWKKINIELFNAGHSTVYIINYCIVVKTQRLEFQLVSYFGVNIVFMNFLGCVVSGYFPFYQTFVYPFYIFCERIPLKIDLFSD